MEFVCIFGCISGGEVFFVKVDLSLLLLKLFHYFKSGNDIVRSFCYGIFNNEH